MTMRIFKTTFLSLIGSSFISLSGVSPVSAQTDEALQISGFARVVLGYLDEKNATYMGYDDGLSLDRQSLIGLHVDYKVSDSVSVTGQFVGQSSDERESGIDWLYLNYEPTRATQIKLGRQRTPFFNYSDSIDVGFAYPWITLPQEVYSSVFFPTFDGILGNYQWSGKEFGFELEGYWGSYDDAVYTAGAEAAAKIQDLRGLIGKMNFDNWAFRASYHTADALLEPTQLKEFSSALKQAGFFKSANSLNPEGHFDFYQVAASYENLNYFFRAEVTKVHAETNSIAHIDGYFVAVGYNFYPFVSYLSLGENESEYNRRVNEIPVGINPQLDALAVGYQIAFNRLPGYSSKSITLGTRWDWKSNLALKAEVTWVEVAEDSDANFFVLDAAKFDRKAPLFQLALEWIF